MNSRIESSGARGLSAVILAAGKGTRMNSDLPKVCHPVGGRAMVCSVIDACVAAGCGRVVVVVGYQHELVRDAIDGASPGCEIVYAMQDEQLGTGHAVRCAAGAYSGVDEDVFVLCGDGPLIRAETLRTMLDRHRSTGASATLATAVLDDPSGYGRVVRDADGGFARIVEQKNATEAERAIREVNPSYYCFRSVDLFDALEHVGKNELTGEYYVTDVPALMLNGGGGVEVIDAVPSEDVLSINTPAHLAEVDRLYRSRAEVVKGGVS
jgi:bifunctional UDP-N-acetylglucosamine pyrophosphorylase/glucosamine-1-phosphate N-acetyltransferase